jgi:hypothetical protein
LTGSQDIGTALVRSSAGAMLMGIFRDYLGVWYQQELGFEPDVASSA